MGLICSSFRMLVLFISGIVLNHICRNRNGFIVFRDPAVFNLILKYIFLA